MRVSTDYLGLSDQKLHPNSVFSFSFFDDRKIHCVQFIKRAGNSYFLIGKEFLAMLGFRSLGGGNAKKMLTDAF